MARPKRESTYDPYEAEMDLANLQSRGDKTNQNITGKEEVTIAKSDIYQYHSTEQPRIFRAGDIIPEGWNSENRSKWKFDDYGKWELV